MMFASPNTAAIFSSAILLILIENTSWILQNDDKKYSRTSIISTQKYLQYMLIKLNVDITEFELV